LNIHFRSTIPNRQSKIANKNGSPGLGAAKERDELNLSRPVRFAIARGRERVQHHGSYYTWLRQGWKNILDSFFARQANQKNRLLQQAGKGLPAGRIGVPDAVSNFFGLGELLDPYTR
jgi:hypothetical protein